MCEINGKEFTIQKVKIMSLELQLNKILRGKDFSKLQPLSVHQKKSRCRNRIGQRATPTPPRHRFCQTSYAQSWLVSSLAPVMGYTGGLSRKVSTIT